MGGEQIRNGSAPKSLWLWSRCVGKSCTNLASKSTASSKILASWNPFYEPNISGIPDNKMTLGGRRISTSLSATWSVMALLEHLSPISVVQSTTASLSSCLSSESPIIHLPSKTVPHGMQNTSIWLERTLPSIALFSSTTDLVMDCSPADTSSIRVDGRGLGYPTIVTIANNLVEMNFVTSEANPIPSLSRSRSR